MKRFLPLAAFLLAILGMAAAGVAIGRHFCLPGCSAAGAVETAPFQQVEWLTRTLDLTPDQRAAIERLETAYRGVLATQCAAHCAAKARLREVLFAPAAAEATTAELLEAMAAAQTASERATLEHIRQIHRLLTPAQRPRFEAAVVGSVCGCSTGLHGCAASGHGDGQ